MAESVKPIIIRDDSGNVKYELEFTRESVRFAEQRGFDIREVGKYPMSKLPELFFYAFRAHHKSVSRSETDKVLFEELGGIPDGLVERLAELYDAPFRALLADEDAPKNSKMTVEL